MGEQRAPLLYRIVLRLLPKRFRERHAQEMEEMVADALGGAGESRLGRLRVWAAASWDVMRRAPVERVRGRGSATTRVRRVPMLMSDVHYALRSVRRQPAVSALVTGMLALGIAANTAVFTILNGLYLRPFPFPEADRLVYLNEKAPRWNLEFTGVNYPDFHRWRSDARLFEGLALYADASLNLSDGSGAERVDGLSVTHDFAAVLGITPLLGRTFTPDEDRPNAARVVMLGHDLWQRRFGGAGDIVGRTIRIDSEPFAVVGVLPEHATFPGDVDLWVAMRGDSAQPWQSYGSDGVGRLERGVTVEQASQDLMRAHTPIFEERDEDRVVTPRVMPLRDYYVANFRSMSIALGGAVAMVLLIACANVASLMLARTLARRRELGIRMALGAGGPRVLRQLFTENLVLAVIGGATGTLVGFWGSRVLVSTVPDEFPGWAHFGLDARVVLFSCGMAGFTAILFGLAPAFHAFRNDPGGALQESGTRSTASSAGRRTLAFLVAAEVALAAMLLVGGGLLIRGYQRLQAIEPGFRVDNVLSFGVALPAATYDTAPKVTAFWDGLMARLSAVRGVESAAAITCAPFGCHWGTFYEVEGEAARGADDPDPVTLVRYTTPDYAETMGIRLTRGRFFEERDGRDGNRVIVVNEQYARQAWPDQDPIGKRMRNRGQDAPWMTVIGVTEDVRHYGLENPVRPAVYQPITQNPVAALTVVVRARANPTALSGAVRETVRSLDADLPIYRIGTMEEALRRSLSLRRTYSWMLTVFAAIALLLAVGGLYGVTSYAVTRRTREIGIRVALGARASQVTRSVLRGGMTLVLAGLFFGLLGAGVAARAVSSLLFGVQPSDAAIYATVALLLGATAFVASWVPARRAARISPMTSLRAE